MDKQNFLEGGEYQVSGKTFNPIQTKSVEGGAGLAKYLKRIFWAGILKVVDSVKSLWF